MITLSDIHVIGGTNLLAFPHLYFTIESSHHLFTCCKSVIYKSFHFFRQNSLEMTKTEIGF